MTTSYALGLHFGHLGGGGRIGSLILHLAIWSLLRRLFIDYPEIAWPIVAVIVALMLVRYVRRRRGRNYR